MVLQLRRSLIKKPCRAGMALLVLVLALGASPGFAADLIADYFSGLNTFQSSFTQTVTDSNGERLQDAQGRVWMQRPGRFRWTYDEPEGQFVVADGSRVWLYDADLEQVSHQSQDEALKGTPALLLSDTGPVERHFEVVDLGTSTTAEEFLAAARAHTPDTDRPVHEGELLGGRDHLVQRQQLLALQRGVMPGALRTVTAVLRTGTGLDAEQGANLDLIGVKMLAMQALGLKK